eukprot:gene4083-8456_t
MSENDDVQAVHQVASKIVKTLVKYVGPQESEKRLKEYLKVIKAEKKAEKRKKKCKFSEQQIVADETRSEKSKSDYKNKPDLQSTTPIVSSRLDNSKSKRKAASKKKQNPKKSTRALSEQPPNVGNCHPTADKIDESASASYWEHANLGSVERKSKFLRLMGAGKTDSSGTRKRNASRNVDETAYVTFCSSNLNKHDTVKQGDMALMYDEEKEEETTVLGDCCDAI